MPITNPASNPAVPSLTATSPLSQPPPADPANMNAATASSRVHRAMANTSALSTQEASLSSSDRHKYAQNARRELSSKVREDWSFQWHGSQGPSEPNPLSQQPSVPTNHDGPNEGSAPENMDWQPSTAVDEDPSIEYRRRSYSPSGSSSRSPSPEYKFENPDLVLPTLAARARTRRRRWRRALSAEMQWNAGLAHWTARRDAWCGVRRASKADLNNNNDNATDSPNAHRSKRTRHSPTSTQISPLDGAPTRTPSPSFSAPTTSPSPSSTESLVPVAPPLLDPTHPIRAAITPAVYPQIFTKVVTKSQTPTVPINLKDVTAALVQGWKNDDEWPPKIRAAAVAAAPLDEDVPAVRRKKRAGNGTGNGVGGDAAKGHRSRGSLGGSVRKVFGFRDGGVED
ncbi:MAG: hypothetical protein M1833_006697 [Piccolia ochrophora]|nr:MAG: hypothetical protein M1833_006697 [Piccolia ochrophora]